MFVASLFGNMTANNIHDQKIACSQAKRVYSYKSCDTVNNCRNNVDRIKLFCGDDYHYAKWLETSYIPMMQEVNNRRPDYYTDDNGTVTLR